jgi:methionyl-tRNA formyltransferase
MRLSNIALVAASTTRSSAYLQALARNQLLPGYAILLESAGARMPGQFSTVSKPVTKALPDACEDCWSESAFDPALPVRELLDRHSIPYALAPSKDINDSTVVDLIASRPETVFIYSGFGGVLLRESLLSCGKRFLHVHGGYLPAYKGSTTNYYSLLDDGSMGASSIFLSAEIDSGPILIRKSFPAPAERGKIDHVYDSAARAYVLIETLRRYLADKDWKFDLQRNEGGEIYYIIHPVLKHIAILDKRVPDRK